MDLLNKVVLITGGSTGYGKGTAEVFKECGSKVWIVSRNKENLENVATELGINHIVGDISIKRDWDRIVKSILKQEKTIDILINNAGAGVAIKPLIEQTDEEVDASIKTNLLGHIYGIMRIGRIMVERNSGIIINITSLCAEHAWPGWSVYSAAKAGIEQLNKCLHNEFRGYNIRIMTLSPSWGATDFLAVSHLPKRPVDIEEKTIQPREMGELIIKICTTPDHLIIPHISIQPMIQEINPM